MSRNKLKSVKHRFFSSTTDSIDSIEYIKSLVQDINHKLTYEHDTKLDLLKKAYGRVEPYQPIYGISMFGKGQRGTRDRCDAISKYLGDVSGTRILDVGCYAGYATFYFADRGAQSEGIDNRPENIEVCNLANDLTGYGAKFRLNDFSKDYIHTINEGQYDIALILSVLHWTIHERGLKYVQECMKHLVDKIPVIIVELAQKNEDKTLYWNESVPINDLDIFAKCKDIKIDKIGDFPTHLSNKKRPLYAISNKHVTVNRKKYLIDQEMQKAYKNAPRWRPLNSKYYICKNRFIKLYKYDTVSSQTLKQSVNEINFFLQNESILNNLKLRNVPKLIDFEINERSTSLVFERIEGTLLSDLSENTLNMKNVEGITKDLIDVFAKLEEAGFYHNDIRSWNIIVNKFIPNLIDFELTSTQQIEDNYVAFLWVINTMLTGVPESQDRLKTKAPLRQNFMNSQYLLSVYDSYNPKTKNGFKRMSSV